MSLSLLLLLLLVVVTLARVRTERATRCFCSSRAFATAFLAINFCSKAAKVLRSAVAMRVFCARGCLLTRWRPRRALFAAIARSRARVHRAAATAALFACDRDCARRRSRRSRL